MFGDGNVEIGVVKLLTNKENTLDAVGLESSVILVT